MLVHILADFPNQMPQINSKWDLWEADRLTRCTRNNLFRSVYECRLRTVKIILDSGININTLNDYGYSTLIVALHIPGPDKRSRMVRYLINRDANPAVRDVRHGRPVLSWACVLDRPVELQFLLHTFSGELDIFQKDFAGMTTLHYACQSGNSKMVSILCQECRRYGLSVDVHNNLGITPYLHANKMGYHEIAKVLYEQGMANSGQSDILTFRNGGEWALIGIKEKKLQEAKRRRSELKQAIINGRSQMVKLLQISSAISRLENLASSKTKIQEPEKRTGPGNEINLPCIMKKFAEEITPSFRRGAVEHTPKTEKGELPILVEKGQKKAKKGKSPKV